MTTRNALQRVGRATDERRWANENYRAAILEARQAGASLYAIARAANTGAPNVLRIIRRATKGDDQT